MLIFAPSNTPVSIRTVTPSVLSIWKMKKKKITKKNDLEKKIMVKKLHLKFMRKWRKKVILRQLCDYLWKDKNKLKNVHYKIEERAINLKDKILSISVAFFLYLEKWLNFVKKKMKSKISQNKMKIFLNRTFGILQLGLDVRNQWTDWWQKSP